MRGFRTREPIRDDVLLRGERAHQGGLFDFLLCGHCLAPAVMPAKSGGAPAKPTAPAKPAGDGSTPLEKGRQAPATGSSFRGTASDVGVSAKSRSSGDLSAREGVRGVAAPGKGGVTPPGNRGTSPIKRAATNPNQLAAKGGGSSKGSPQAAAAPAAPPSRVSPRSASV